jgi:hypothetical protein
MRCQACDKNLNDWESTKKNEGTGKYYDLCSKCLNITIQDVAQSTYDHDILNIQKQTYIEEEDVVQERPTDFDYYEEDWDKYD